ncbi:MAG: hypothetical protein FIA94_14485 [Nitrospirae bacterium]|nr:hypothetical protein [Nitrospirota bacterium]
MSTDGGTSLPQPVIRAISCRKILNSHVAFTNEFIVELGSGEVGIGASPQGETISIYEDRAVAAGPAHIIETVTNDHRLDVPMDQVRFDAYLEGKIPVFGRNNAFALSLAFYNAVKNMPCAPPLSTQGSGKPAFPRICLNILNGGGHAYTNPVLSDFPEYLLVSKGSGIEVIIEDHRKIQQKVRERLFSAGKKVVNGNTVNTFGAADNRLCIEMLLETIGSLKLDDDYDLMIDASAGDLWSENGYRFSVTDDSIRKSEEMCDYWLGLIADFSIKYLEDPFHEKDFDSWKRLTAEQGTCSIIGDNLYSSDVHRIRYGACNGYTHGVIIKPNQAGTVTATIGAIQAARDNGQAVITSHRSISTESLFLSTITHMFHADGIKIGPLFTDYSSVIRLNELMRLQGAI